jgi:hypothetical protein
MKSPMIAANPALLPDTLEMAEDGAVTNTYSDLMVLRSAAGYYVGTLYEERDASGTIVWREPGSRDSGYFPSEEAAAAFLQSMTEGNLTGVRLHP